MSLLLHVPDQIAQASSHRLADRLSRLQDCLKPHLDDNSMEMGKLDMDEVKSLCAEGVPNEVPALRAALWKVLLGYLPLDTTRWDRVLSRARTTYAEFLKDLETDVRGVSEDEHRHSDLQSILHQVSKDVTRTRTELGFFGSRLDGAIDEDAALEFGQCNVVNPQYHYDVLARILLLFAKLNRGVKYAQGMNELCAPLYYLFSQDPLCHQSAEADTFFCFNLLMTDMQDAFVETLNDTGAGMLGRMDRCSKLLKEIDEPLWAHLEVQVHPIMYSCRWIMSMLTQELEMPEVLRVWDTLLGSLGGPRPLLHDLCVARVIMIRDALLASDDVECVRLLQRGGYPSTSVEDALRLAVHLHNDWSAHLGSPKSNSPYASSVNSSASTSRRGSLSGWLRTPRTPRTPRDAHHSIRTSRITTL